MHYENITVFITPPNKNFLQPLGDKYASISRTVLTKRKNKTHNLIDDVKQINSLKCLPKIQPKKTYRERLKFYGENTDLSKIQDNRSDQSNTQIKRKNTDNLSLSSLKQMAKRYSDMKPKKNHRKRRLAFYGENTDLSKIQDNRSDQSNTQIKRKNTDNLSLSSLKQMAKRYSDMKPKKLCRKRRLTFYGERPNLRKDLDRSISPLKRGGCGLFCNKVERPVSMGDESCKASIVLRVI